MIFVWNLDVDCGFHLRVELVVTQIQRCVDGFERLKVDVDFLFFPFVRYYGPAVHH